jgi:hypothetical protein
MKRSYKIPSNRIANLPVATFLNMRPVLLDQHNVLILSERQDVEKTTQVPHYVLKTYAVDKS